MRALALGLLLGAAVGTMGASTPSAPSRGDCAIQRDASSLCVYRSLVPSAGIVSSCRDEQSCRVGYYYGSPAGAVWFRPPPAMTTLPKPEVSWLTATFAEVRLGCGHGCSFSYFFEARRHRVSDAHPSVLAVEPRRFLIASAEDRALVIRQVFSGRQVMRLERDWAPGEWLGDVLPDLHFDPDGRLSFTWLRGSERTPVSERVSVPSIPRP
jgi:hypothetical protein